MVITPPKCTAKDCNNPPSECESNWASLCEEHAKQLNMTLAGSGYGEEMIKLLKELDSENYRRRKIQYLSQWN